MSVTRRRAALTLAALLAGADAQAQYFGRNKVQYRSFDFEILATQSFDVYFYPEERQAVQHTARMAERWYARLSKVLGHQLSSRQPLILYADHPAFEQTNAIPGQLGEGTGGVTEGFRRRVVMPLAGPLAETDHVLGHELVHAFQYDIAGTARSGLSGLSRLPLWFVEGMAEYLSLGPVDPHTAMWMRDAVAHEKELPKVSALDHPRYFPYRWGQAFWSYVAGRWGDEVVAPLLRNAASTGIEPALEKILGVKSDELSKDWHAALRKAYAAAVESAGGARPEGRRVIGVGDELVGRINVGPALSPDGRRVAFLSERSLFSIDLYVADAETGKIQRKLTETAVDPHVSSLQFIQSAGAWSADGARLVYATVATGRPELVIYDFAKGQVSQKIRLPTLGEVFHPTWSPDGRRIAFSALVGGLTDLYAYDLASGKLSRLTDDAFADLQPAWSPDGRRIAFVTDRFSSALSDLRFGHYRLGLLEVDSGEVRPLAAYDSAKHINPQWAPDGKSLYFVSDRHGISNVHRLDLASGRALPVTRLAGGASGITALSPALAVAARSGRVVASVYEKGGYALYVFDADAAPAASAEAPESATVTVAGTVEAPAAATLPPLERKTEELVELRHEASFGLPPRDTGKVGPYSARLSLERVGQPYVAVGADRFGTFVGGGAALFWSDILGDHNLVTALQGSGRLADTAALVGYQNLKHRWNWGVSAERYPYTTGAFERALVQIEGEPALLERTTLFRQVNYGVSGVTAYPFNQSQRVEVLAGFRHVRFERDEETLAFSLDDGRLILDDRVKTSLGDPLNLGEASLALVHDTTSFGATSPVLGSRYRIEASPTFGSLQYWGLLADYRQYFMPLPLYTFAGRVLHYGRYGSGGEDERLSPLFLGYPNLVRGYDVDSFSASECEPDAASTCPAFDRLLGSRVLVGNLEFRFPLLRPFGLTQRVYGPIPAELAFFADAGVAWQEGETPELFGGERKLVSSAGVALRVNFFGAVLELDYVRPFQRPDRGWLFQFNLTPGF